MKRLITYLLAVTIMATFTISMAACSGDQKGDTSVSTNEAASVSSADAPVSSGETSSSSSKKAEPQFTGDRGPYSWAAERDASTETLGATTVYLVGDSTVCDYDMAKERTRYYPRNGYGMWLNNYLFSEATIVNLALSGRSSKSYLAENNYATLTSSIKAGDYLIIGFGHNDEKGEAARFSDANGSKEDEGSLKYNLYNYYIKVALDAGATPILCTPIARYSAAGDYSADKGHITKDTTSVTGGVSTTYRGGNYPKAIRELGEELGVTVIDLTALTIEKFTDIGVDETKKLFSTNGVSDYYNQAQWFSVDGTHVNSYGASIIAEMFVTALKESDNPLKNYVNDGKVTPLTYDQVYISREFLMIENGEV